MEPRLYVCTKSYLFSSFLKKIGTLLFLSQVYMSLSQLYRTGCISYPVSDNNLIQSVKYRDISSTSAIPSISISVVSRDMP